MPNRILKESICTSDDIDQLTWFEEVLFYRLMVNCDDFGRFDGRTAVIKNRLFPLKENVTAKAVESAVNKLASVGLVVLYIFEDKPYLHLPTWNEHQTIRAKRSKYPSPDESLKASEIICKQMQANASKCSRNPIRIQSESNPNPNTNDSTEPQSDSVPVITLPLNDGTEFPIFEEQVMEWMKLYPAVDVLQQLRSMRGWLLGNQQKRKTKRGILGFVTRWLGKEQDKGKAGKTYIAKAPAPAAETFGRDATGKRDDMEEMRRIMLREKEGRA